MADKEPNCQVFFITSNQSKINEKLDYSINQAGIINLKPIVEKTLMYKREDFTTRVFSFEIIPNDLKEKDKTVDKKKYLAKITLKFNKCDFKGEIPFFKERNNFSYGFSFQDYKGWTGTTSPPIYIKYTKAEQIQLFNEVLKKLNVKQGDPLSLNLISDSQLFITGQKFYLDHHPFLDLPFPTFLLFVSLLCNNHILFYNCHLLWIIFFQYCLKKKERL